MTTPLSQEVRAGLVAVAAPVKTPYASTILAYEATVVALTEERDAALERVKALEAVASSGLTLAVMTQAFVGRDRGTVRQDKMLDGLVAAAKAVDAEARALLTPKDPGHG